MVWIQQATWVSKKQVVGINNINAVTILVWNVLTKWLLLEIKSWTSRCIFCVMVSGSANFWYYPLLVNCGLLLKHFYVGYFSDFLMDLHSLRTLPRFASMTSLWSGCLQTLEGKKCTFHRSRTGTDLMHLNLFILLWLLSKSK